MNKLRAWGSESIPRWWVFVLLLMVAVLVEYDDNPNVLESKGVVLERTPGLQPSETVDSVALRYVEAWGDWWRMDLTLARQIIQAADKERVPHHVAFGLIAVESGFNSKAVGRAGEVGLTQIKPSTARMYDSRITAEKLKVPETNLTYGLRYFHDLLHRFNGDVMLALAAYNMGPTAVSKRIKEGRQISTRYSNKVLGR